jgi:hypothetical protein
MERTPNTLLEAVTSFADAERFPFIFSDESGVVLHDPSQPFYGVGMLKLSDAGRWSDALNRILDRYVSAVEFRATTDRVARIRAGHAVRPKVQLPRSAYELKFSEIKSSTRIHYEEVVDYFTTQTDGYFCALILDKRLPGVDPMAVWGTPWDCLIAYSVMLFRNNIRLPERAIIIADNYQKPKNHPHFYERQVASALGNRVANVAMMDSASSVLLQLVDVLLGAVLYHHKLPTIATPHTGKKAIADRLAAAYGVPTLARSQTHSTPNYFSVCDFRPPPPGASGP